MSDEPFDPAESDIEFGRSTSGKVHVIVPLIDGDGVLVAAEGDRPAVDYGFLTSWFRSRTLCGRVLSQLVGVEAFPDTRLCLACCRHMGEHSDRLFEHPEDE